MNNTSYISISNNFSNLNINLLCKVYKTQFINSIAETTYIVHVINSIAEVQLHLLTHKSYGLFGSSITLESIHNITWKDRNAEICRQILPSM